MPKPPNIIRPVALRTTLPEDVRARLDLYLLSETEGRVPKGAYQAFFLSRIREFFESRSLDVGPWLDPSGPPAVVSGSQRTIDLLTCYLKEHPYGLRQSEPTP